MRVARQHFMHLTPQPMVNDGHLFTNSFHGSRAQLDKEQDPAIVLAWQRLKLLTKGLNQEAFPRQGVDG